MFGLLVHVDALGHILFDARGFEQGIEFGVGVVAVVLVRARCGRAHPRSFQGRDNRRTSRR
ncbi:MAG: hypothetical protein MZV64_19745 [Ignavibacteriales bacterium]|nr:hypothetical protein [Ignavibacteriales bacterium]